MRTTSPIRKFNFESKFNFEINSKFTNIDANDNTQHVKSLSTNKVLMKKDAKSSISNIKSRKETSRKKLSHKRKSRNTNHFKRANNVTIRLENI